MSHTVPARCECLAPDCSPYTFHETDIGVDLNGSVMANVSLFDCCHCGSRWLHYSIGDEAWSQSIRWYRGPISFKLSKLVTSQNASQILGSLAWYYYGGRDFDMDVLRGWGPIPTIGERGDRTAQTFEGAA